MLANYSQTKKWLPLALLCGLGLAAPLRADQVVMQNGDVFNGRVMSVTTNSVVLQNDNLGTAVLPRVQVVTVNLGQGMVSPAVPTNFPVSRPPGLPPAGPVSDPADALRGIRAQTNLIQMVQAQVLGSASPEAVGKYNEMLDGLSTGKMDINGLRQQAQAAADQLRSLKKDAGPDAGDEMDGYLAILDNFLRETAPGSPATNSPAPDPGK